MHKEYSVFEQKEKGRRTMGKKEKNEKKVGFGKMLAWNSRGVSQGIGLMVVGYLSLYCTDTLKLTPGLVGTLLLVSKLLDGVTDIIAGYLVDRTNTKIGRGCESDSGQCDPYDPQPVQYGSSSTLAASGSFSAFIQAG